MRQRVSSLLVFCAMLGLNRSVNAELSRVELKWRAPPTCQRASAVQRKVERALADAQGAPSGRFVVTLNHSPSQYVAYVLTFEGEVQQDRSVRRLEVATCQDAEKAASLFIVLSLDPAGVARLADANRDTPLRVETDENDAGSDNAPQTKWPAGFERALFLAGVGATAQSGLVAQGLAPGVVLSAATDFGGLRVRLAAERLLARTTFPREGEPLAIQLHSWSGAFSFSYLWSRGLWKFGPELAGQFVSVQGKRPDAAELPSESVQFFTLGAGARTEFHLTRWVGLSFGAQIALPTTRPSFSVEGVGTVFRASSWGLHTGLELIFTIPFTNTARSGHWIR